MATERIIPITRFSNQNLGNSAKTWTVFAKMRSTNGMSGKLRLGYFVWNSIAHTPQTNLGIGCVEVALFKVMNASSIWWLPTWRPLLIRLGTPLEVLKQLNAQHVELLQDGKESGSKGKPNREKVAAFKAHSVEARMFFFKIKLQQHGAIY